MKRWPSRQSRILTRSEPPEVGISSTAQASTFQSNAVLSPWVLSVGIPVASCLVFVGFLIGRAQPRDSSTSIPTTAVSRTLTPSQASQWLSRSTGESATTVISMADLRSQRAAALDSQDMRRSDMRRSDMRRSDMRRSDMRRSVLRGVASIDTRQPKNRDANQVNHGTGGDALATNPFVIAPEEPSASTTRAESISLPNPQKATRDQAKFLAKQWSSFADAVRQLADSRVNTNVETAGGSESLSEPPQDRVLGSNIGRMSRSPVAVPFNRTNGLWNGIGAPGRLPTPYGQVVQSTARPVRFDRALRESAYLRHPRFSDPFLRDRYVRDPFMNDPFLYGRYGGDPFLRGRFLRDRIVHDRFVDGHFFGNPWFNRNAVFPYSPSYGCGSACNEWNRFQHPYAFIGQVPFAANRNFGAFVDPVGPQVNPMGLVAHAERLFDAARETGQPVVFVLNEFGQADIPRLPLPTRQVLQEYQLIELPLSASHVVAAWTRQPPFAPVTSGQTIIIARSDGTPLASVADWWDISSLNYALAAGWMDSLEQNPPSVRDRVRAESLLRDISPPGLNWGQELRDRLNERTAAPRNIQ